MTVFPLSPVKLCESQKHLDNILDKHLNFHQHIERKIKIKTDRHY